MKTAILCLVLAALAAVRGITQGLWNREHTADGFLGYEPMQLVLTLAIAAIAGVAGVYLLVKSARKR